MDEDEWAPIENNEDNFVSQVNAINLTHPKTSEVKQHEHRYIAFP